MWSNLVNFSFIRNFVFITSNFYVSCCSLFYNRHCWRPPRFQMACFNRWVAVKVIVGILVCILLLLQGQPPISWSSSQRRRCRCCSIAADAVVLVSPVTLLWIAVAFCWWQTVSALVHLWFSGTKMSPPWPGIIIVALIRLSSKHRSAPSDVVSTLCYREIPSALMYFCLSWFRIVGQQAGYVSTLATAGLAICWPDPSDGWKLVMGVASSKSIGRLSFRQVGR